MRITVIALAAMAFASPAIASVSTAALAALVGPVETSDSQRQAIGFIVEAQLYASMCSEYAVDETVGMAVLLNARLSSTELAPDGRRKDVVTSELGKSAAFLKQTAEDYKWSEQQTACFLANFAFGPNGRSVKGLMKPK